MNSNCHLYVTRKKQSSKKGVKCIEVTDLKVSFFRLKDIFEILINF